MGGEKRLNLNFLLLFKPFVCGPSRPKDFYTKRQSVANVKHNINLGTALTLQLGFDPQHVYLYQFAKFGMDE